MSFLKDTTLALEYKTAYLVTNGDTLISWSKEWIGTTATYLNTKITKTVWEDSVEVCIQRGFMLDDFEEHCSRKILNKERLNETFKNVEQYLYLSYSNKDIQVLWKSYSKGVLKKGVITEEEKDTILSKTNFSLPMDKVVDLNSLLHSRYKETQDAEVVFILLSGAKIEAQANLNVDLTNDSKK